MKKIVLLLALTLLTATLSFSQDNTAYRESFRKMMIANGSEQTFKVVIDQMITSYKTQRPEVKQVIWDGLAESFHKLGINELLDLLLPVYQKHLSLEDIKNMTAFYDTPTGKRFAEQTPAITQESMQAGQVWGQKIGEEFAKKLAEKGN
ncbi:DUF2059 domain-containing protein [Pedobacter cryoconitis]|uniref:DUF2059 domain-containing protein n=1 Tax=Pedobacter cryoconitis TaxID=188932 RepID=A0A327T8F3_9SPHI|nr:DUF2059 domain-containing protein [Pedobacter cryoconitis]RAJ37202.1 hypothetical protein LY11_00278 [Pedobacter cryoconitis]